VGNENKNKVLWYLKNFLIYVCVPYITVFWVWYKKKWSIVPRVAFTVWAVIALVVGITGNSTPPSSSTSAPAPSSVTTSNNATPVVNTEADKAKAEAEAKAKEEADAKAKADAESKQKQYKELVQNFEKAMYELDSRGKPAIENFQKALQANNIYTAYEAAKNAKAVMQNLQSNAYGLDVSKELPEDVKKLLNDAKQDLSTCYYSKRTAFDYAMKFFDDQKPSSMQKYKDEMSMADNFMISSAAKLTEAKIKVGLQ
jgi:hypothetical protein